MRLHRHWSRRLLDAIKVQPRRSEPGGERQLAVAHGNVTARQTSKHQLGNAACASRANAAPALRQASAPSCFTDLGRVLADHAAINALGEWPLVSSHERQAVAALMRLPGRALEFSRVHDGTGAARWPGQPARADCPRQPGRNPGGDDK